MFILKKIDMKLLSAVLFCTGLLALIAASATFARDLDEDLIEVSLKVFPRLVAVDLDLKKKTAPDGKIKVLLIYNNKQARAETIRRKLMSEYSKIAGIPVGFTTDNKLPENTPTAIFITERLNDQFLNKIVDYSISHNTFSYSPFESDIEKGVTAGISIGIRIVPYLNRNTLNRSEVRLHKILLNSSKLYE